MLRKQKTLISLVVVIAIILLAWITLDKVRTESKRALTIGTVNAVGAALYSEIEKNRQIFSFADDPNVQEWRMLSEQEYDRVIADIGTKCNLDAPRGWKPSMPLKDFWGNRFVVCYRNINEDYDILIISKGPDSNYGTKDDVINEYGVKSPMIKTEQNGNF